MTIKNSSRNSVRVLFFFFLALTIYFSPLEKRAYSAEPADKNNTSLSKTAAEFEKIIYKAVKDLDYSDQVAQEFVAMVRLWKCDDAYQKLRQSREEVKQRKLSWAQYAEVEKKIISQLAQTIKKEIADADISQEGNSRYFDLSLVVREKKAQCLGYSQVFYIMGNSVGLTVQGINIEEPSRGPMPSKADRVACEVGLNNGKAMQVDLTLKENISKEFKFTEEYGREGIYWKLKQENKSSPMHPLVQLLDNKGFVAAIYNNRGIASFQSDNFSEAISDYDKAIDLNPRYAEAFYNRGKANAGLGKLSEAFSDYSLAIQLNPSRAEAYSSRGNIHCQLGKTSKAISDCDAAIKLNPRCAEAYNHRGTARADLCKLPEAIADFNKAIELNPKYADAYNNRGLFFGQSGKLTEALADFNKAIELNPRFAEAYCNRGNAYNDANKPD